MFANSSSVVQNSGRTIDCFAGLILIASAFLKAVSPIESAMLVAAYGLRTWMGLLLIQLEVVLGMLLLTGIGGRNGRIVALIAFSFFACFSAYRAVAGYESCGCFGAVTVHPRTTFAIDALLILLLAWSIRHSATEPSPPRRRATFAFVTLLVIGSATGVLFLALQPQTLAGDESLESLVDGLVILEPETWIGNPLPIAKHISPSVDVSQGEWTLLLYHHDCPDCRAALPHYEQLAEQRRVALVEIPPYGDASSHSAALSAKLSNAVEWFVEAPVEIQVRDGIVLTASHDLPSIAPLRNQLSYNAR